MGRVAIIGVVLVALMVMAEATVFVETDEELDNQFISGRCRQELSNRRLHSCQRYLQRGGRGLGELILRRGDDEESSLQECCRELRHLSERCRCPAIRQALEQAQRQQGQGQGQEEDDEYDRRERDQDYYDRRGSSQDYDRRGSSQDYDRQGSSQDYDRRGSSQDYDRRGGRDQEDPREILRRAENLPNRCRLNRPQRCPISGAGFPSSV